MIYYASKGLKDELILKTKVLNYAVRPLSNLRQITKEHSLWSRYEIVYYS